MSIPTGADYQICVAKIELVEIRDRLNRGMDTADCVRRLADTVEAITRALELIQRERKDQQ